MAEVLAAGAVVIAIVMTLGWLVSVLVRDVSIVDPLWAFGAVAVAWVAFVVGETSASRGLHVVGLVTIWGMRLGGYLVWRKIREPGEDRRYRALRARVAAFPVTSLPIVFLAQGVVLWIVALPVMLTLADDSPDRLYPLAIAGTALWAVGMFFETVGDAQLARFKADRANKDRVLDRGLWRHTRHPNYFGEACVWWGIFLVCLEVRSAWPGVVGPVVMTALLVRGTGASLLERTITSRRPGYADYARRTNAFLPGRPGG